MSNKPNIVIFRLPAEDAADSVPMFAQISIEERQLVGHSFQAFSVAPGDSYLDMKYDQVKFAYLEGNLSKEICSFSLSDDEGIAAKVWEIGINEFNIILPNLLTEIENIELQDNKL